MEDIMYYIFCGLCLGGAVGVLTVRGYVNQAMSMLASILGAAGLLLLMKAYFLAFVLVMVYAGAVLVLFVFVVMLIGDKRDGAGWIKRGVLLLLWAAVLALIGVFEPQILRGCAGADTAQAGIPAVSAAKNYGIALFTAFMLPFEIAGITLLAAMVGVIAIAKHRDGRK